MKRGLMLVREGPECLLYSKETPGFRWGGTCMCLRCSRTDSRIDTVECVDRF